MFETNEGETISTVDASKDFQVLHPICTVFEKVLVTGRHTRIFTFKFTSSFPNFLHAFACRLYTDDEKRAQVSPRVCDKKRESARKIGIDVFAWCGPCWQRNRRTPRGIYEPLITSNAFRIISHAARFSVFSPSRLSSAAATGAAFNFSSAASNENRLGNPFLLSSLFLAEEIRDFFRKVLATSCPGVDTLSSAEIIDLFFRARANESSGNYGTSSDSSRRYTQPALESPGEVDFNVDPKSREWLRVVVTQNVWRGREVAVDETNVRRAG